MIEAHGPGCSLVTCTGCGKGLHVPQGSDERAIEAAEAAGWQFPNDSDNALCEDCQS